MTRIDDASFEFLQKMAGEGVQPEEPVNPVETAQTIGRAVKAVKNLSSAATAPRYIAKQIVGAAVRGLMAEPEKHAGLSVLALFELLNRDHGQAWWDWEPETLAATLHADHDIDVTPQVANVLGALQVTVKTNAPFEHWHVFEKVAHAFNFSVVDFDQLQPHELHDVALALKVLATVRPRQGYEPEVAAYIAACAMTGGVVYLPAPMFPPACQGFLNKLGNNMALLARVERCWPKSAPPGDEALAIQIARLSEVREYIKNA
jgi:hypothetical protein